MTEMRTLCPHCGSGDIQFLVPRRHHDLFDGVRSPHRRCLVCGVRWEIDDLVLDSRPA